MRLKVDVNRQAFPRIRTAAQALLLSHEDFRGPVLTRLAQAHRIQQRRIFSSEGAEGGSGRWAPLSPDYADRKRAALRGERRLRRTERALSSLYGKPVNMLRRRAAPLSMKILVWSGDMRDRFVTTSRGENVERYVPTGRAAGRFEFGAESQIAVYHFRGGRHLPRRDMVTKSPQQIAHLREVFLNWYRSERVPQVRAFAAREARAAAAGLRRIAR